MARIITKNKETVEQLLRESMMKDGDVVSKAPRREVVKKIGTPLKCSKSRLKREEDQEIVKQGLKESTVNDKSPLCELKAKKRRGSKVSRKTVKKPFTAVEYSKSELEREDQEIVKQVLKESTVNDKDPPGKTNAKKDVRKTPRRGAAKKLLTPLERSKSELKREDQEIVKQVLKESTMNDEDCLGNKSAKKVGRGRPRKDSKISLAKQAQKKEMTVWLERNNYQIFFGKSAVITEGSIPDDFLPLNLNNFEVLDTQGPSEKTRIRQPYAPKVAKTSKSKGRRLCQKLN